MVLSACKDFIDNSDDDVMKKMLLREWEIYCKNKERFFMDGTSEFNNTSAKTPETTSTAVETAPDLLVTAVAALVDMGDISEDEGATVVASYMKGK